MDGFNHHSGLIAKRNWLLLTLGLGFAVVVLVGSLASAQEPQVLIKSEAAAVPSHSYLQKSNPVDGAMLANPPKAIKFEFNDEVRSNGLGVSAAGPLSKVNLPPATASGRTVKVNWPELAPAGDYVVTYRVVSSDGHVMNGDIGFTLTHSDKSSLNSKTELTSQNAEPQSPGSVPAWLLIVAGLAVAVGMGLGGWMWRKDAA